MTRHSKTRSGCRVCKRKRVRIPNNPVLATIYADC